MSRPTYRPVGDPLPSDLPPSVRELAAELAANLAGEVRFDRLTRILYSTDASNYQIEPLGVVRPRDADEVAAAVSICARHSVPLVPRGGGSSLAGQAIGPGVVLDLSAHLHGVQVDPQRQVARVGAGTVLDRLNRAAAPHGLAFGPDPASADRACLGGVIGNNSTGAHSLVYGMAADHLRAAEVVLADGRRARLAPLSQAEVDSRIATGGLEGRIYTALADIVTHHRSVVEQAFPRYWRRSGGYNLDRLVARAAAEAVFDPTALLAGSEGTLAVATAFELKLVPLPRHRALAVAHFDHPLDPFRLVPSLLETGPSAIELLDRVLIGYARQAPGYAADAAFIHGHPEALLVIEYSGASQAEVDRGLAAAQRALRAAGLGEPVTRAVEPAEQAAVWRVRQAGLGLLMRMRGDWKPVAGIEDTAVPPDALATYMAEVRELLEEAGVRGTYYAHAGAGCIHIRPILNLHTAGGVATLVQLADQIGALAQRHGGVQSSEHGDGLARGAFNRRQFGEAYPLLEQVKAAFDPNNLLNPGKVVGTPPPDQNLRYGPAYRRRPLPARFVYPEDGDIAQAIEQCNGAAVCRRLDGGTMCPSYRVTGDEAQSTRGRANALRAVLDGRLPLAALTSEEVWQVMELCLGCKACRSECPSGVDMARLKTEVAAARCQAHGAPWRARLFASLHALDRCLVPVAPLANAVLLSPLARVGARLLGLAAGRSFPPLVRPTFDQWWLARQRQERPTAGGGLSGAGDPPRPADRLVGGGRPEVVLFADTLTNYHQPQIGRAAVAVLEAAGFQVLAPPVACCGRPALSQGLVDQAVATMRTNLELLAPFARRGLPILVPEPSCASALREEMPDLLTGAGERERTQLLAQAVHTLEEFLARLPSDALPLLPGPARAILHTHCHQRAATGPGPGMATLDLIPGLAVEEPDAGCCGMAGAFGYQAEHYTLSLAMAERVLAPVIRAAPADTVILAAGASCRQQIADTTGRRALHPVELLARCLPGGEIVPEG